MSEQEIAQLEFEKFKRELIASINQMTIDDIVLLVIQYGKPIECTECGQTHKGARQLDNCGTEVKFTIARIIEEKAALELLGIDNNRWGKPKEN